MGMNMGRIANAWFRAGLAIGLLTVCVVSSSGQDKKAEEKKAAKSKKATAAQKDAPKPAPPANVILNAVTNSGGFAAQGRMVNEAQIQAWENAYGAQFRQVLRTELHFMRLVTEPTRQEYDKIADLCDAGVKDAIRSLLVAQYTGNVGAWSDVRAPIAAVVARSVQATLSAEQAARYDKELEQRTAARKKAVVDNLVAMVDKAVVLNAEQREKIGEVLANNWTESWNQNQLLVMLGRYFPTLPDAKILPILTDAQRDIWRTIPKTNARWGFDLSNMPVVPIADEAWDGDAPPKRREPAGGDATPKIPEPVKAGR
jgi:hypothetical protein